MLLSLCRAVLGEVHLLLICNQLDLLGEKKAARIMQKLKDLLIIKSEAALEQVTAMRCREKDHVTVVISTNIDSVGMDAVADAFVDFKDKNSTEADRDVQHYHGGKRLTMSEGLAQAM
jgi:hypothetical protein